MKREKGTERKRLKKGILWSNKVRDIERHGIVCVCV